MKILGIIPARGGSKGVPGKNSKTLHGKPLMQYTAESALSSKRIDELIFSSEDDELQQLAKSLGLNVPFSRPPELATDSAGSLKVVLHALDFMEEKGAYFDAVCLLQVTNPFRKEGFIDKAIEKYMDAKLDSLISVLPVPHEYNPHWVFEAENGGTLKISTGETAIIPQRQQLPRCYHRDGSIYITASSVLRDKGSLFGSSLGYIESDPDYHVNIDTPDDWQKAESLAKKIYG